MQAPSFELPPAQISVFSPEVEPGLLNLEIDTEARLLLKNLIRSMRSIDTEATSQHEQIFAITAPTPRSHANACLFSLAKPDTTGFETLNAHMRIAWPGRRIHLTKSTPMGLWHLTYLLGIVGEGSSIYARLAPELFQASGCDRVLNLIHSCTTLVNAAFVPEAQTVELFIHKLPPKEGNTTFISSSTINIPWHQLNGHASEQDHEWNATFYSALNLDSQQHFGAPSVRPSGKNKQQNLRQQLAHELDSQGLPEFPAAYIYHISAEELEELSLDHSPWHICQSFMGSYTVCDSLDKLACEATGAKAHALVMASYLHNSVLIPKNEEQCSSILRHYLEDLKSVYMHILEEAHVHLKTSAAAKRFGNIFWKELPLPLESVPGCRILSRAQAVTLQQKKHFRTIQVMLEC